MFFVAKTDLYLRPDFLQMKVRSEAPNLAFIDFPEILPSFMYFPSMCPWPSASIVFFLLT